QQPLITGPFCVTVQPLRRSQRVEPGLVPDGTELALVNLSRVIGTLRSIYDKYRRSDGFATEFKFLPDLLLPVVECPPVRMLHIRQEILVSQGRPSPVKRRTPMLP